MDAQPKNWMPGCMISSWDSVEDTLLTMLPLPCASPSMGKALAIQEFAVTLQCTKLKESSLMKSGGDKNRYQTRPCSVMLVE